MASDVDGSSTGVRRRGFLVAGGLAVALAGCVTDPGDGTESPANETDSGGPEAVVERFFDALDDGDIERVNGLLYGNASTERIGENVRETVSNTSFSVRELETREATAQRATVHVVYAMTDERRGETVAKEATFELRTGGDGWKIRDVEPPIFGATVVRTAPSVTFSFDLNDGTLVITHSGGQAVSGDAVFVEIGGERVGGVFEAGRTYTAADSVRVQPPSGGWDGQAVRIVWESGGETRVLSSYTAPQ
ncbi:MAG: hypothetical protein ABEJ94_02205 [Halorientalis sp.]